jgi:hypothetical protein
MLHGGANYYELAVWCWRMNFSMALAKPSSSLEVVT